MSGARIRVSLWGLAVAVIATGVVTTGSTPPAEAVPSPGLTELLSLTQDGSQGAGAPGARTADPVVSGDGRHTAFATRFPLDPADDNDTWDVYVRSGSRTVRITTSTSGASTHPSISADGRYVAFGLSDDDRERVLVCDRDQDDDGVFDEPDGPRCVDVGRPEHDNREPSLSADATRIAWNRRSSGETWEPPSAMTAMLVKDAAGRLASPESFVELRPTDPAYGQVEGGVGPPRVSADGRHVVFPVLLCETYCSSLRGRPLLALSGRSAQPMRREAVFAAELDPLRLTRLDVGADGSAVGDDAADPAVSANGRTVAFVAVDRPTGRTDVVVLDRDPHGDGVLGPAAYQRIAEGAGPALSADGRYLAFHSAAPSLHNGLDTPFTEQVVVRDLRQPPAVWGELASPGLDRDCVPDPGAEVCAGNGDSHSPALSADGSVAVFVSEADDLVPGDDNEADDVFARTFRPTVAVGAADFGTVAPGGSTERAITVRHRGFGPLRFDRPTVAGPQAGDFTVFPTDTCVETVLHAGESCVVSVRFRPAGTGNRSAMLRLVAGGRTVSVPLTGVSGGGPSFDLRVTPPELAFPGERPALSVSLPETVTITNTGSSPLTVRAVRGVDGPRLHTRDYLIVATNCPGATLAPGRSCTVTVHHLPHGAGERPGALLVETDAFSRLVALRARGTVPTVVTNPGVVVAGRVVQVTGTGFPPDRDVTITLPGNGSPLVARTDQVGAFTMPMPVFDHGLIGSVLTWVRAPDTELLVPAPLLVVPGSYQPPAFIGRR